MAFAQNQKTKALGLGSDFQQMLQKRFGIVTGFQGIDNQKKRRTILLQRIRKRSRDILACPADHDIRQGFRYILPQAIPFAIAIGGRSQKCPVKRRLPICLAMHSFFKHLGETGLATAMGSMQQQVRKHEHHFRRCEMHRTLRPAILITEGAQALGIPIFMREAGKQGQENAPPSTAAIAAHLAFEIIGHLKSLATSGL
ncbi:hypothetical protein [Martelella sp. AD-3]|uniref:hypothetical protein n=1 Tax=Martelella sp. AD-3 TaxID=686597 RepID=UPI0013781006|nr:hypothetical protein [Martelella sp. AD-3]